MDDRGVLGHPPSRKVKSSEICSLPALLDAVNRDWVQSDRPGPFAHLTEALSGIYPAKPSVLIRQRRSLDIDLEKSRCNEVDADKFRKVDLNGIRLSAGKWHAAAPELESRKESHGESRVFEKRPETLDETGGFLSYESPKSLSRHVRNQGYNRQILETEDKDSHCRDARLAGGEMGKGTVTFSIVDSSPMQKEGKEKAGEASWPNVLVGAEQSMQIKLGKAYGLNRASTHGADDFKKQTSGYWEQSESIWEYGFIGDPVPTFLGRSSFKDNANASVKFGTARSSGCSGYQIPTSATGSSASLRSCKLIMRKLPLTATARSLQQKSKITWLGLKITRRKDSENEARLKKQQVKETESAVKGQEQRGRIVKQLLCGGFAGVVSRTAVAPLDLIKTHLITSHSLQGAHKSALTICKEIVEQGGWQGLFRGNLVNCIRVAPNKAIELCVFEMVRRALNKEGHPLKRLAATIAGGAAGMAGTIATYPLELIRTRLSVQPELYSGLMQAVSRIAREEGFGAFYSGLSPSLVGVFPYAATNYFVYDALRTTYCNAKGQQNVPTFPTLLFGAVAAAASSAVTYPLEVARRQMQLCTTDVVVRKSTIGVIQEIYRHEGFFALYRGLGTTWLKLIPAAGISFVCYEAARLALHIDDASLVKPEEVSSMAENELDS